LALAEGSEDVTARKNTKKKKQKKKKKKKKKKKNRIQFIHPGEKSPSGRT